jgi:hypothetical protein
MLIGDKKENNYNCFYRETTSKTSKKNKLSSVKNPKKMKSQSPNFSIKNDSNYDPNYEYELNLNYNNNNNINSKKN